MSTVVSDTLSSPKIQFVSRCSDDTSLLVWIAWKSVVYSRIIDSVIVGAYTFSSGRWE